MTSAALILFLAFTAMASGGYRAGRREMLHVEPSLPARTTGSSD